MLEGLFIDRMEGTEGIFTKLMKVEAEQVGRMFIIGFASKTLLLVVNIKDHYRLQKNKYPKAWQTQWKTLYPKFEDYSF